MGPSEMDSKTFSVINNLGYITLDGLLALNGSNSCPVINF